MWVTLHVHYQMYKAHLCQLDLHFTFKIFVRTKENNEIYNFGDVDAFLCLSLHWLMCIKKKTIIKKKQKNTKTQTNNSNNSKYKNNKIDVHIITCIGV